MNMRQLTVTDSDNIEAVGYDTKSMQLGVVFKTSPDKIYGYECTRDEFAEFVSAESMGSHFHKVFKKRAFTKSERPPTLKK